MYQLLGSLPTPIQVVLTSQLSQQKSSKLIRERLMVPNKLYFNGI